MSTYVHGISLDREREENPLLAAEIVVALRAGTRRILDREEIDEQRASHLRKLLTLLDSWESRGGR